MTPSDIRDIRGPITIPYWWIPFAIGVAVIAALALAYVAYRLIRKYRKARAKTAAEIALERIERARGLFATSSSSGFSDEISNAVRAYIEARFQLRAPRRTTEEFLRDVASDARSPIAAHRDSLEELLGYCDLSKFARLALSAEDVDTIVLSARQFVEATRAPAPAPAKPPTKTHEPTRIEASEVAS